MASIQATRLRKGNLIKVGDDLLRILELHHLTPGNKRGFVQCKARNIRTNTLIDTKFRAEEDIERAILDEHDMQYLYTDGDSFHFMNSRDVRTAAYRPEVLGDAVYSRPTRLSGRVLRDSLWHRLRDVDLSSTHCRPSGRDRERRRYPARTEPALSPGAALLNFGDPIRVTRNAIHPYLTVPNPILHHHGCTA